MKKIMICVLTSNLPAWKDMAPAIKSTWGDKNFLPDNISIKYYYGKRDATQTTIIEEDDDIYCLSEETFNNMILKTIDCFRYCFEKYDFDYILRPCDGSYFNLKLLNEYVEKVDLNNAYCGVCGDFHGIPFVSGSGYLISRDLIEKLINYKGQIRTDLIDDVEMGRLMGILGATSNHNGIRIDLYDQYVNGIRMDLYNSIDQLKSFITDEIKNTHYHYHFRHESKIMYDLHSVLNDKHNI